KKIPLKIVAYDDQIVGFGFDAELVAFQIGGNTVDGEPFIAATLSKNFNRNSRIVHRGYLPSMFSQPYRMLPGSGCNVECPARREPRSEAGDQGMWPIINVLALLVALIPIRHPSIIRRINPHALIGPHPLDRNLSAKKIRERPEMN